MPSDSNLPEVVRHPCALLGTGNNAFGDPVNTAFKLAEDVAEPWDVLVAQRAFSEMNPFKTEHFGFEMKQMEISKVQLEYQVRPTCLPSPL